MAQLGAAQSGGAGVRGGAHGAARNGAARICAAWRLREKGEGVELLRRPAVGAHRQLAGGSPTTAD